jgi:hypothetical protein
MIRNVGRLEQRTLLLGFAVTAVGAVIALFAWLSTNGVPFQGKYPFSVALPGTTPPIASGAQVRIAGKIAGTVTGVRPSATTLRVDAEIASQYAPLGRGASVHVGVLLGTTLVYLVVNPGDYRHPLPAGTVIPESRVTLSSSLPQALETFDAATRRALARNITVTGEGWIGRGAQTNTAIADQRFDYTYGTPLLRALSDGGAFGRAIAAAAPVTRGLRGQRPDDNAVGTSGAAAFWQTLARSDRAAVATDRFAGVEQQLLATLPLADATLAGATSAVRSIEPLALQVVAEDPAFEALFSSGRTLVDATTRFNRYAPDVLRGLLPVFDALRRPALALPAIVRYGEALDAALRAYGSELEILSKRLSEVTGYTFAGGPAMRISGSLACAGGRDAYPRPGQAAKDRHVC